MAAWLVGYLVVPDKDFWLLAAMATVVMPTDLAPAVALIRDRRVPARLRQLLNVESGLNDGAVAPIFLLCVAAAHTDQDAPVDMAALVQAVPALVVAIAAGAVIGWPAGWLLKRAYARDWTQPSALRIAVLALPLMAYGLAIVLNGNGFVAAFVAGILFEPATRLLPRDALHFTEDMGTLMGLVVWFIFGRLINATLADGTDGYVVVYALLAISLVRILPVVLSLVGTDVTGMDRLFLGWLGPRGLASIVFGLLAYIDLSPPHNAIVLEVMVVTVLASVVIQGLSYGAIGRAYGRSGRAAREDGPDEVDLGEPGRTDRDAAPTPEPPTEPGDRHRER